MAGLPAAGAAVQRLPMRVAYLTTAYPSVSHTFIRRELVEVERQTGEVARFAIRDSPYDIVDPDDKREDAKTFRLLKQPAARWARAVVQQGMLKNPVRTAKALRKALELGYRSERGLPVHIMYLAEALVLLEETERRGIDHIHVHFGTNPASVAQLCHAMGGPTYSFTVHGPDELDAPRGFGLGPKIADSAFTVAITDFCAGQLRRWVGHEHWHKIKVVHCTVGDEFFDQARPIDPTSKALVCVGRLSAQKGQLLLVEGFADAIDKGVDAELVLVGDGDMRGQIEDYIAKRGVTDRVRITGWISGQEVREELLAARALALPSFAEGLPMVIMEAFALTRPVLTTYIAGIPELVVDGENGFLFPSGSAARICEGIERAMSTPVEKLDEMGRRGREAVKKNHYTPTETAKLVGHIRQVVDAR